MRRVQVRQWLALAVVLLLLFTAFIGFFGYGLYVFVRWAVTLVALYWAYRYWRNGVYIWLAFVIAAIVFNPLAKLPFGRETWQFLDLVAALLFCYPLWRG